MKQFTFKRWIPLAALWGLSSLPSSFCAEASVSLDSVLQGRASSDTTWRTQGSGLRLRPSAEKILHPHWPHWSVRGEGDIQLETGSTSAPSTQVTMETYGLRNRASLTEALVAVRLFDETENGFESKFQLGVLDQSRLENDFLISKRGFPGLMQELKFHSLQIQLEQTLSTGSESAPVLGQKPSSSVPLFFHEKISWRPPGKIFHQWPSISLAMFHFVGGSEESGVPESVAQESRYLGNTVEGLGPSNARFIYGFQGWWTEVSDRWSVSSHLDLGLRAGLLNNWKGPTGNHQSRWARAEAKLYWPSGGSGVTWGPNSWTPFFQVFEIGSDSVPAAYTDRSRGHQNRRGFEWGLRSDWNQGFFVEGRWIKAAAREPTIVQSNFQWIEIGMGFRYEIL